MEKRVEGYVEIDDGQIIFRLGDLSITVSAETAVIYRYGSGSPPERVPLSYKFWDCDALKENEEKA